MVAFLLILNNVEMVALGGCILQCISVVLIIVDIENSGSISLILLILCVAWIFH